MTIRDPKIARSALVAAALLLASFVSLPAHAEEIDPSDPSAQVAAVMDWLECEECHEGQLDKVLWMGEALEPTLVEVFRRGPSTASRELVRRDLERQWEELEAYFHAHPQPIEFVGSKEEMVEEFLANYDARHRVRAVIALTLIGSEEGQALFEEALAKRDLRDDVLAVVEKALEGEIPAYY